MIHGESCIMISSIENLKFEIQELLKDKNKIEKLKTNAYIFSKIIGSTLSRKLIECRFSFSCSMLDAPRITLLTLGLFKRSFLECDQ